MSVEDKEPIELPSKPWFTTSEVLKHTQWTKYFLRSLEEAKVLNPYRYKPTAQRKYSRAEILKVFEQ